jgi:4-amino-4-deoxy-L-arabinose transferase-like glycosyltransferase
VGVARLPWAAQIGLVLALTAAVLLPSLGSAPLERAEIYFMDAARAMVETGDWLVPRYQGEEFFDKPALTYWLMAASFRAFGFTLAAGRLVSALAALACVAATAWLGRLLVGRREGACGALVFGTTVLVLAFGRVAMSDMLLTLSCTLAVAIGVSAADARGLTRTRALALGATLGLGFLTKGPVALVFAGFGLLLLVLRGLEGRRLEVRRGRLLIGAAAFAVTGLAWFAAVAARLGAAPLVYFFFRENLERFAGATYDAERSPFYYVGTYLAAGLPWSLLFPLAAWRQRRRCAFLLLWMGLMAVPLSLSRGKIDYYLLPLLPAASVVVGAHLSAEWPRLDRSWARAALIVFALIALAPMDLAFRLPPEWLPTWEGMEALIVSGIGVALAASLAAARPSPRRLMVVFAAGTAITFAIAAAVFLPAFRASQPNADVVADVRRERAFRPDAEIVVCGDPARVARDLLFEARVVAQERCDVWNPASSHRPFLLLVSPEHRRSLEVVPGIRDVDSYRCVPAAALSLRAFKDDAVLEDRFVLLANYRTDDPVAEIKRRQDRKRALRQEAAAYAAHLAAEAQAEAEAAVVRP